MAEPRLPPPMTTTSNLDGFEWFMWAYDSALDAIVPALAGTSTRRWKWTDRTLRTCVTSGSTRRPKEARKRETPERSPQARNACILKSSFPRRRESIVL